jgi:hypothetical protein
MTRTLLAIAVAGAVFSAASAPSQAAEVSWRDHEAFASYQDDHGKAAEMAPERHSSKLGALRSTLAKFAREHSEEIQAMFAKAGGVEGLKTMLAERGSSSYRDGQAFDRHDDRKAFDRHDDHQDFDRYRDRQGVSDDKGGQKFDRQSVDFRDRQHFSDQSFDNFRDRQRFSNQSINEPRSNEPRLKNQSHGERRGGGSQSGVHADIDVTQMISPPRASRTDPRDGMSQEWRD